jgi:hypothetical protein
MAQEETPQRVSEGWLRWNLGLLAVFCVGLRGEEIFLIKFEGTAKSLKHMRDAKASHFVFVVPG